ncbi:MAG: hypothetical protein KJZ78_05000 [Bryobacteraceae bacterium]|nr:hypothetical protein [Bryobacteraceae bacterium]
MALQKISLIHTAVACLVIAVSARADLKPETTRAFEQYVAKAEQRIAGRTNGGARFLWVDESPARMAEVRRGGVAVGSNIANTEVEVPDGLIHDWTGAIFIPGVTLDQAVSFVKDYDNHKKFYPEVVQSKLIGKNGDDFKIHLRLKKKKVLTVVLDTYYDVHYTSLAPNRVSSRAYSTRIQEVENAGEPGEKVKPAGTGRGFLWRLNSYWRFEERDGGVYVELDAISLTRDVPTGLGWLIEPIVRGFPKESLNDTLKATRDALVKR